MSIKTYLLIAAFIVAAGASVAAITTTTVDDALWAKAQNVINMITGGAQ